MNKLIQELAAQATIYIDPTANDGVCWDFDKEKFAELIIRECADIATMKQHEWHSAGSYILEHFGVK
jgi:hypothetical protein